MEQVSRWLKLTLATWVLAFVLSPVYMLADVVDEAKKKVYVIPVEQTVERGLEAFLKRSFKEAQESGAERIILDINTPGGAVDAAGNIARIMNNAQIPVTAFINSEAISAGAYIALNADEIVMVPNGQIGSAGVIDGEGNAAEEKMQSLWISRMITAAEEHGPDGGRDPAYARAMADHDFDVDGFDSGYLTLNADQAHEVGYAEAITSNLDEVIAYLGYDTSEVEIVQAEVSIAEHIARFVTHPFVIPILLSVGSLGLVVELYSPGFGIPGTMGISALLLFFYGHMVAGFAGWESLILLGIGVILLGIEIMAPGFGIFGILGIGAMIGGLLMASFSTTVMIFSIAIALVLTIILAVVLFVFFGDRGPWKRLVLQTPALATDGTDSSVSGVTTELVGQEGHTLTDLRPAGIALIGDDRLDVVSEGGYIPKGSTIKVVHESGARVVVRTLE